MRYAAKTAGALLAFFWVLSGIALIIFLTAGDGRYLADRMLACAPPEQSGLPAEEYPGVGMMTAGYLTGRTERFQYTYEDGAGRAVTCFQEHEEAHMADCRELIRLDRTVMIISGGAALALIGAGFLLRREKRSFFSGMLLGLRALLAAAAGMMIWALVNFEGFFVTFHRIAFTNDGWLLNPRTDLLIRLMPESFFISLGIRGMIWAVIPPAAAEIAARAGYHRARSRDGK